MQLSRLERSLILGQRGPRLSPPDGEGGGSASGESESKSGAEGEKGSDGESKDRDADLDKIEGLGDKGKAAIKAERDARKTAEDAKKAADDELATLRKENTEREAAEAKAKDDEAKQKGEFEKLAEKRGQDLDAAKGEVTTLKADNEALRTAMAAGIKAGWKELPEEVRKLGEKQHPEEDVLGRFQFLNDPDTKALVTKLTDKADPKRGNGVDPKSNGSGNPEIKSLIGKASFLG